MTRLTFYGGARELGGTQILLEDRTTRLFLDFGLNFDRFGRYFPFPHFPKKFNALDVLIRLGIYPELEGIYRQDYLRHTGRSPENKSIDGVVVSHAHLDHAAGVHFLRPDIDVWMDKHTKKILYALQKLSGGSFNEFVEFTYAYERVLKPKEQGHKILRGKEASFPRSIKLFQPTESFKIGDIEIQPFYIDHSMPGSCAFIIHTSIGPIVYTGDLRLRGRRKKDTEDFIKAAKDSKPKYLLCEGSLIHKRHVGSEDDVVTETVKFISRYNGLVITSYPPRDLDRLTSMYRAAQKTGRLLVIDTRQAFLLDMFNGEFNYPKPTHKHIRIFLPKKGAGFLDSSQEFAERDYFLWERKYLKHKNRVMLEEIKANPCQFMIYSNFSSVDDLVELEPPKNSVYFRSHPEPYTEQMELDEKILINWLKRFNLYHEGEQVELFEEERFNIPQAHVTGHMSMEETGRVIREIDPGVLIPIHTLFPERFREIYGGKMKIVEIGDALQL